MDKKQLILLLVLLFCIVSATRGQANRYNANWCFGHGAGIKFHGADSTSLFRSRAHNFEFATSVSDTNGQLQYYIGKEDKYENYHSDLFNAGNQLLAGGSEILTATTYNEGALFLQMKNLTYLFHYFSQPFGEECNLPLCRKLFYSIIKDRPHQKDTLITKNELLFNEPVDEGMGLVKHANGRYWWLLVHGAYKGLPRKTFYRFLIKNDTIQGPWRQDIGTVHHSAPPWGGEMDFSYKGNQMAYCVPFEEEVGVYEVSRCNGRLANYRAIERNNWEPYGCEFSPDGQQLYFTEVLKPLVQEQGYLHQVDVTSNNFNFINLWKTSDTKSFTGQLELAPDGRIYLTTDYDNSSGAGPFTKYSQNLGVIHHPDSSGQACNFQPFSFYLGDSARSSYSLPEQPNYELGPLSIYQTHAGANRTVCPGSQVQLGTQNVAGVQYQWQPAAAVSQPNSAQPTAIIEESQTFTVTFTDTSITNACQSRTDSVSLRLPNRAQAGASQTKCPEDTVIIGAERQAHLTYTWQPSKALSDPTNPQPLAFPDSSTAYVLTAKDTLAPGKCAASTDTVVVAVQDSCSEESEPTDPPEPPITIPTLLRQGSTFHILNLPEQDNIRLRIYNILGQIIYKRRHYRNNWSLDVAAGVYIYRLQLPGGNTKTGKFVVQ